MKNVFKCTMKCLNVNQESIHMNEETEREKKQLLKVSHWNYVDGNGEG